ncbi:hypothetical protein HPP92_000973 [Vanilla planifolia]|uniref:Phosphatidylinositol N-acetylglucosaminyltransferase subunit H conserved domain-containing protein n=1 Tax=Vanilla planifolia TaxID=51239 RepID=A0A835RZ15_VANPL|nr:hypothetical protein HPP92_000973 [Vanilla planifolia]
MPANWNPDSSRSSNRESRASSDGNYAYTHLENRVNTQAVDIHEIFFSRSRVRLVLSYLSILLFLASCYELLLKDKLWSSSFCGIIVIVIFTKFVIYKPVKKESVLIFPTFGVQLESHYWSGRINRRFVPFGKILSPVINECLTPFNCYWSLALILRGEEQLLLVFQELKPPLKMLVPVWKALRSATCAMEESSSHS